MRFDRLWLACGLRLVSASAPIAADAVPTSLYVLGAFIAAMLALIGGLLCFAICVRPLVRQKSGTQSKEDYQF